MTPIQKRKNTLKVLGKTIVEYEEKISKDNPWTYSKICGVSHVCKNGGGMLSSNAFYDDIYNTREWRKNKRVLNWFLPLGRRDAFNI